MENLEINHAWVPKPQSERPLLGFASSDSSNRICHSTLDSDDFTEEEALSQRFESVGLGSNEDDSISGGRLLLPLRPYADDCQYYLRTGTCKFELNCRYNHPVRRTNQKAGGKEKENDKAKAKERLFEKPQNIECKFYLTAEGCKYGKRCRYNHSKDESEITPPELNFLGLPIRLGEKECPFYMQNGSCGYGAHCKFHHPDRTDLGGYDPDNSTPGDEYGFHPGNYSSESIPLHVSGVSQSDEASWLTHMLSNSPEPYEDNHSSYMPMMNFTPQDALQTPEWNGYQAPSFPEEMIRHPLSAPAAKSLTKNGDMSNHVEEFPERPGQPECDYFVRTGYCKFKSACRYHHPMNQAPKADCVLSDNGLPLRPGRKICWHYEQFGICKFGRACLFNHPENDSSTNPSGSPSESP